MKLFALHSLLLATVFLGWACTKKSDSKTKDDAIPPPATNPFSPESFRFDQDSERAAGIFGFASSAPAQSYTNGRCTSCHASFASMDGLESLMPSTYRIYDCLAANPKPERTLACIGKLTLIEQTMDSKIATPTSAALVEALDKLGPKDLGVFAAAVNHSAISRLFQSAGLDAFYQTWKQKISMPYGRAPLPDADAQTLVQWFMAGLPNIVDYVRHTGPDVCKADNETFIGKGIKDYVQRMSSEGEGWEFVNLSRGVPMFACNGNDKASCFKQKGAQGDLFPRQEAWLAAGIKGEVRALYTYKAPTSFWVRSSADGRYIAAGGSPESSIVDLQPLLQGGAPRLISVEAEFDPAFTPDNQAFMFQGQNHGTRFCVQSVLEQDGPFTLDFRNAGCSTTDLQIGLYQGIGSSLQNGDIVTLNGGFQSDEGQSIYQDQPPLFPASSNLTVSTVRRASATAFEKLASFTVETPYHASWMTTPSQGIAAAVVSAATAQKARHGGYRLILSQSLKEAASLPAWDDSNTAMLCTGSGEKPNFSFDERLMAYYAYQKQASKLAPTDGSADIYVIDLLGSGKPVQLTKMPKGLYAQFPHFRSDGWLYFTVYDAGTRLRSVVATDAAIQLFP